MEKNIRTLIRHYKTIERTRYQLRSRYPKKTLPASPSAFHYSSRSERVLAVIAKSRETALLLVIITLCSRWPEEVVQRAVLYNFG